MRRDKTENQKNFIGLKRRRKIEAIQPKIESRKKSKNKSGNPKQYRKVLKRKEFSAAENKNHKNNFKFCLTVHAKEKDFDDPIKYFEKLWDHNKESTGIIKIIPPKRWNNFNSEIFDKKIFPKIKNNQKTFETRIQTLNELLNGKKFQYARDLNFNTYLNYAENFFKETYHGNENPSLDQIEKDFWKVCKQSEKIIKVRYAADLSYKQFLSKAEINQIHQILEKNDLWNFSTLFLKEKSLFRFLKENETSHISGLTIPWIYLGMLYSTFCWHVEDLYLYSVNYMHYGKPKIWYGIPHNEKEKMDNYIKSEITRRKINDENVVHRLILLIDPKDLIRHGISVYKAVQHPGEIIFTLPKAYHCGFSTGFNISEAVNLATCKWVDIGLNAQNNYNEALSKMPVFPVEWLIYQNILHMKKKVEVENLTKKDKFKLFVNIEKHKRKKIQSILTKNKIPFHHFKILPFNGYDKYECDICTSYGFFSFMICISCNLKLCMDHSYCGCSKPMIQLMYRDLELY